MPLYSPECLVVAAPSLVTSVILKISCAGMTSLKADHPGEMAAASKSSTLLFRSASTRVPAPSQMLGGPGGRPLSTVPPSLGLAPAAPAAPPPPTGSPPAAPPRLALPPLDPPADDPPAPPFDPPADD